MGKVLDGATKRRPVTGDGVGWYSNSGRTGRVVVNLPTYPRRYDYQYSFMTQFDGHLDYGRQRMAFLYAIDSWSG